MRRGKCIRGAIWGPGTVLRVGINLSFTSNFTGQKTDTTRRNSVPFFPGVVARTHVKEKHFLKRIDKL